MPTPTQRDIATRVGVTQACVSLALRGSPRIRPALRERIKAAAEELGYQPDGTVAALARRRWSQPQAIVAYVGPNDESADQDAYYRSVAARCRQLGLTLLHVPTTAADPDGAQAMLDRRRIAGVIVGQVNSLHTPHRLAWDRLRTVHCGMIVPPERGDIVLPDLSAAVPAAWRAMERHGYRRIAAVHYVAPHAYSEHLLSGSLLALEREIGDKDRFAVWVGPHEDYAKALAFIRRRSPDAVLGYHGGVRDLMGWHGMQRPFAALVAEPGAKHVAGMVLPFAGVGAAAVDLLLDRLRDPPGAPAQRRMHLIEMMWRDAASLPVVG